eukprot:CAMPEP_0182950882 /NCGR_PEP_ID=MMETSP0105_2-20130417/60988_1 /TAXON_ID=81532 ORGANISM="Acanthoeca-like sp., Strain 10tr" /NCGR_SAMPLE_ID=MMETSP0105_2 /ASSEMBLY_ACC=CAM_ASM_000205 /LENGTH=203 /DNA_ID=CAMNT_0025091189 /DNA_START=448 /DNA_END=1059 /DNA_ORIENTATION=-
MAGRTVLGLAVALGAVASAAGFGIRIDAHEEECFHDDLTVGTKVGMSFQVAEGGFLDIDVMITGPDSKIIYSGERESDGKYTFSAHMDGRYKYCFSNKMSSVTAKLVVFNINLGRPNAAPEPAEEDGKHDRLQDMIRELSEALFNVKREQALMEVRDHTHRQINESTNSRVVWWSFVEFAVLILMSVGQVYYISRFFEVKTTV